MANKVFGVKNITHLLYGVIVLLPMFAILGRVIYTQSNPNAKDSYSGHWSVVEHPSYATNEVNTIDDLIVGNIYDFTITSNYVNTDIIYFYGTKIYNMVMDDKKLDFDIEQIGDSTFAFVEAGNYFVLRSNSKQLFLTNYAEKSSLIGCTMQVVYGGTANQNYISSWSIATYIPPATIEIDTDGTLDNAFEYSLKTFTEDNNLGGVDMFSWFTDLFLDHSNPHNQIYIGFVNWYLNYTMLVSCGYLFFLVLIWFINFIRRILDKSMYQDYGGF